jgi:hypothetical protein
MTQLSPSLLTGLVWFAALSATSCSNPFWSNPNDIPGTIRLDVEATWNGAPIELGEVAMDHLGHNIQLQNLQMYISRVELRDLSGEWIGNERADEVHLVDFNVPSPRIVEPFRVGTYDAIRFSMGLPPGYNGVVTPSEYPNDHPLSVAGSAGMFWTWLTGYIAVKYEGRVSQIGSEILSEPLSYHCGTDSSHRVVTLELGEEHLWVWQQNLRTFRLQFDAAKALNATESIDVIEYPVTHNGPNDTLASRLMDNLAASWTLIP